MSRMLFDMFVWETSPAYQKKKKKKRWITSESITANRWDKPHFLYRLELVNSFAISMTEAPAWTS